MLVLHLFREHFFTMIQVLQMPYKGVELAMMIVLPKPDFTFDEFQKKFIENHFLILSKSIPLQSEKL